MDGLRLNKATADDHEFAYQTKKLAFRNYVDEVGGWDEKEQRQLHERRFKSQDFYVIQAAGTNVGILALVHESDCVKLNQLFILPQYQSKGFGVACMEQVMENAEALAQPVRLRVLKVNSRAMVFYQRLEFKIIGETDTHILMESPDKKAWR